MCYVFVISRIPPLSRLAHLRLPPPPLRPPPPPPRMLEEPRELLARALLPLEPEPPPKALEFRDPPPPEVLRLPTRSPLPRFAPLSFVPELRLAESLPPALCWRFPVSLR